MKKKEKFKSILVEEGGKMLPLRLRQSECEKIIKNAPKAFFIPKSKYKRYMKLFDGFDPHVFEFYGVFIHPPLEKPNNKKTRTGIGVTKEFIYEKMKIINWKKRNEIRKKRHLPEIKLDLGKLKRKPRRKRNKALTLFEKWTEKGLFKK